MVVPIHRDQRPEVIVPHGCWQVEKSLGQVGGVLSLGAPRLSVGIPREDSGGVNPLPTPTSKAAFISRFEIGPKTCSSDTRTHRGGVRVHPSDTPERRSDASARRSGRPERCNLPSAQAKRPFSSLGTPFSPLATRFPGVATPPPGSAEALLSLAEPLLGLADRFRGRRRLRRPWRRQFQGRQRRCWRRIP